MNRVLVTGASGFIGSSLTRHLRSLGYYVVGLTRNIDTAQLENKTGVDEWVQCDLCDLNNNLHGVLGNIDYVVHLAGNAHQTTRMPYSEYFRINTITTEKLALEASRTSVKKFIYISTIKVNGELTNMGANGAFSEGSGVEPNDSYSLSKYEAEKMLRDICDASLMKYVILRPPLVYGPGVKANFLSLMNVVRYGVPLPMASVKNMRSLIYVDNMIDIIERCLRSDNANNQLYLLKDVSMSLPDLVMQLSRELKSMTFLFHCPVSLLYLASALIGRKSTLEKLVTSLEIDDRKIRKELDWTPRVSFDDSIKATVNWFMRRNDIAGS